MQTCTRLSLVVVSVQPCWGCVWSCQVPARTCADAKAASVTLHLCLVSPVAAFPGAELHLRGVGRNAGGKGPPEVSLVLLPAGDQLGHGVNTSRDGDSPRAGASIPSAGPNRERLGRG